MDIEVQKKILEICSQSELGRRLGKRQQTISGWFKKEVPSGQVVLAAKALNWAVTPHELRPDLHPNPSDALPTTDQSTESGAG